MTKIYMPKGNSYFPVQLIDANKFNKGFENALTLPDFNGFNQEAFNAGRYIVFGKRHEMVLAGQVRFVGDSTPLTMRAIEDIPPDYKTNPEAMRTVVSDSFDAHYKLMRQALTLLEKTGHLAGVIEIHAQVPVVTPAENFAVAITGSVQAFRISSETQRPSLERRLRH